MSQKEYMGAGRWFEWASSRASVGRSGGWGRRAVGVVEKQIPPLRCGMTKGQAAG
jgi:hypothetical protein